MVAPNDNQPTTPQFNAAGTFAQLQQANANRTAGNAPEAFPTPAFPQAPPGFDMAAFHHAMAQQQAIAQHQQMQAAAYMAVANANPQLADPSMNPYFAAGFGGGLEAQQKAIADAFHMQNMMRHHQALLQAQMMHGMPTPEALNLANNLPYNPAAAFNQNAPAAIPAATAETETPTAPADQKDKSEGILEKPTSAESEKAAAAYMSAHGMLANLTGAKKPEFLNGPPAHEQSPTLRESMRAPPGLEPSFEAQEATVPLNSPLKKGLQLKNGLQKKAPEEGTKAFSLFDKLSDDVESDKYKLAQQAQQAAQKNVLPKPAGPVTKMINSVSRDANTAPTVTPARTATANSMVSADTTLQRDWVENNITTVMLRNIPNKYNQAMLMAELKEYHFEDCYDFLYLPVDTDKNANLGYAFLNFTKPEHAARFKTSFEGRGMKNFNSKKVVVITPASLQGYAANYAHFEPKRVSKAEDPTHRPLFMKGRPLKSSALSESSTERQGNFHDRRCSWRPIHNQRLPPKTGLNNKEQRPLKVSEMLGGKKPNRFSKEHSARSSGSSGSTNSGRPTSMETTPAVQNTSNSGAVPLYS